MVLAALSILCKAQSCEAFQTSRNTGRAFMDRYVKYSTLLNISNEENTPNRYRGNYRIPPSISTAVATSHRISSSQLSSSRLFSTSAGGMESKKGTLLMSGQNLQRMHSTATTGNTNTLAGDCDFGSGSIKHTNYHTSFGSYSSSSSRLYLGRIAPAGNENDENEDESTKLDFEPTWTYEPYKPPSGGNRKKTMSKNSNNNSLKRSFSSNASGWTVPQKINIPEDKIEISFTRSSGAGGQNVNKVNTQVTIRFHVESATWLPSEVRQRLSQNHPSRINNQGILTISSQEYRTQGQNRKDVLDKLQNLLKEAWRRPKVRKMRKQGVMGKKGKAIKKENKKRRSDVKKNRKRVDF